MPTALAALARKMAEKEPERKAELLRIAENCERVPAEPARDYWEALQFIYFVQMTIRLEGNALGVSLGRMDKYLYPYYQADVEAQKLDYPAALELMECFYLKLSEIDKVASNESAAALAGPGPWSDHHHWRHAGRRQRYHQRHHTDGFGSGPGCGADPARISRCASTAGPARS